MSVIVRTEITEKQKYDGHRFQSEEIARKYKHHKSWEVKQ